MAIRVRVLPLWQNPESFTQKMIEIMTWVEQNVGGRGWQMSQCRDYVYFVIPDDHSDLATIFKLKFGI